VADATAEAIRKVAESIRQPGGEQAVQLKVAERAVDAFGKVAQDSKTTLVIPANMSEVSGLIASAMKMITAVRTPPEPPAAPGKPQVSSDWGRELR
jgi:hypothetical protein